MTAISPQELLGTIAIVVAIGFILDYFFRRTRVPSVLPLMLLGVAFVLTGIISPGEVADFHTMGGYLAAAAIAIVLLAVGIEMDLRRLFLIAGRATLWTFAVQLATAMGIAVLVSYTFHWPILWSLVFGFAASGTGPVVVQAIIRHLQMKEELKTTLLLESVLTDILELIAPLLLISIFMDETAVPPTAVAGLVSYTILISVALGLAAGFLWVWALDRARNVAAGYAWVLTLIFAFGLFAAASYAELSGGIVIFLFGIILGNAKLWDYRNSTRSGPGLTLTDRALRRIRTGLHIDSSAVPLEEISNMQRQLSYVVATFFFFYMGVLFVASEVTPLVLIVPLVAVAIMVAVRVGLTPILSPFLDASPRVRRTERTVIALSIPRGLATAAIASIILTVPGLSLPGFVNAAFLVILFSNIVATIAIFLFSRSTPSGPDESRSDRGVRPLPSD